MLTMLFLRLGCHRLQTNNYAFMDMKPTFSHKGPSCSRFLGRWQFWNVPELHGESIMRLQRNNVKREPTFAQKQLQQPQLSLILTST